MIHLKCTRMYDKVLYSSLLTLASCYNQLPTPENYQLCLTGFVLRTNFATPPLK